MSYENFIQRRSGFRQIVCPMTPGTPWTVLLRSARWLTQKPRAQSHWAWSINGAFCLLPSIAYIFKKKPAPTWSAYLCDAYASRLLPGSITTSTTWSLSGHSIAITLIILGSALIHFNWKHPSNWRTFFPFTPTTGFITSRLPNILLPTNATRWKIDITRPILTCPRFDRRW